MGPMTISVFWRLGFDGFVDFTVGGLVALREKLSSDELFVARRRWEV